MVKIALITGTSSGFGMLSALELARKGYKVIATMRDLSKRTELENQIHRENLNNNIIFLKMDVTNQNEIQHVYKELLEKFGRIDVLINNAGYALGGFIDELSLQEWQDQFKTNVFGPIQVTKAFLPLLRKNGGGKIINISSISGFFGFPGLAPYTSSKHALEGFSESLRLELQRENIWVSLVEPASYQTKIWEKGIEKIEVTEHYPSLKLKLVEQARSNINNSADPQEVAQLIVKICEKSKPKLRYPIGNGAKSLYYLKHLLPWSWIERIVQKRLK